MSKALFGAGCFWGPEKKFSEIKGVIQTQVGYSQGLTDKEIEQLAVNENSMYTLSQYGVELVKEQLTTISEVIRVCKSD